MLAVRRYGLLCPAYMLCVTTRLFVPCAPQLFERMPAIYRSIFEPPEGVPAATPPSDRSPASASFKVLSEAPMNGATGKRGPCRMCRLYCWSGMPRERHACAVHVVQFKNNVRCAAVEMAQLPVFETQRQRALHWRRHINLTAAAAPPAPAVLMVIQLHLRQLQGLLPRLLPAMVALAAIPGPQVATTPPELQQALLEFRNAQVRLLRGGPTGRRRPHCIRMLSACAALSMAALHCQASTRSCCPDKEPTAC